MRRRRRKKSWGTGEKKEEEQKGTGEKKEEELTHRMSSSLSKSTLTWGGLRLGQAGKQLAQGHSSSSRTAAAPPIQQKQQKQEGRGRHLLVPTSNHPKSRQLARHLFFFHLYR